MNQQEDVVINTKNLTRHFDDVVAVDDLNLQVHRGEVFGFLGHNGAGKTTTVRLLNGVLNATAGDARVLNLDPAQDGHLLRRRTGVLTETPSLYERLAARENLRIFAELYDVPRAEVDGRVAELLSNFELADRADERVGGYSKGMKQRLALARTLLHRPEILFLDEPTAGLDPIAAHQVHELIIQQSRAQGNTVFMCTHNLNEAQQLCDRVAVMEHGKMVALGSPAELAHNLWRGTRLEIELAPESAPRMLESIENMPMVTDVEGDTNVVQVTVTEREAIPEIVAALVSAGERIYRLTPQEPTLEDVYFALHREER